MMMPYKLIRAIVFAVAVLAVAVLVGCSAAGERADSGTVSDVAAKPASGDSDAASAQRGESKMEVAAAEDASAHAVSPVAKEPVAPAPRPVKRSSIYLGSDGKMAGTGDPSKPVSDAYKIGMAERPAALAGAGLPKDRFGLIDWVAVVEQGEINPIGSLDPSKPDIPPFEMDVVIEAKGDFVKNVLFPHNSHTYWLGCENCHPAIFVMGKGKNKMSMVEISEGKWCGVCHGKVAFPLTDCSRCHTLEKGKS